MFSASDDPGPSFAALVSRAGLQPPVPQSTPGHNLEITHGTTVVAVRYADGVVIASALLRKLLDGGGPDEVIGFVSQVRARLDAI